MTREEKENFVRQTLETTELLAQLAEECAELTKAALKYRRAITKKNPTPVTEEAARTAMLEEMADISLVFDILHLPEDAEAEIEKWKNYKINRWVGRLKNENR